MTSFKIVPRIRNCESFDEFLSGYSVCGKDLILTDRFLLDTYILKKNVPCKVIAQVISDRASPHRKKLKKFLKSFPDMSMTE